MKSIQISQNYKEADDNEEDNELYDEYANVDITLPGGYGGERRKTRRSMMMKKTRMEEEEEE